jgi:hypothetical protein
MLPALAALSTSNASSSGLSALSSGPWGASPSIRDTREAIQLMALTAG